MKTKSIKQALLSASWLCCGVAAALTSCGDFLEEYSQDTDYVRSWVDLDELLIGDCYIKPETSDGFYYHKNYAQFLHLITDEVEGNNCSYPSSTNSDFDNREAEFGYYTWQQRVGANETFTGYQAENLCWQKLYKCINIANNVLYSVPNVTQDTDEKREGVHKVTGEAYFMRAFYYFYLVNIYGQPYNPATADNEQGVPLKTNAEVNDIKFERNSVKEVYDLIVSDLKAAEQELSQVKSERVKTIYRADLTAVYLMLSRVYLYMQDWAAAADYARKAIERHPRLLDLNGNTEKFMLKNNPENIFSTGGDDVPVMLYYGFQGLRITKAQYDLYSANDLRRDQWLWRYESFQGLTMREKTNKYNPLPEITEGRYYWYAYNDGAKGRQAEVSSVFWLRSAEAYLNLAEAEACLGHDAEARQALNTLRANRIKRGAEEINVTAAGTDLVKAIRLERRKEFILQGQRWFDLRRYRVSQVAPERISITHDYAVYKERGQADILETRRYVLTEDDPSWTLPIPHEVLTFNTGMTSNGNQFRDYTVVPNHK